MQQKLTEVLTHEFSIQGWGERRSYERRSERRSLIVNECANGVHFHAVNELVNGVQKFGERVK